MGISDYTVLIELKTPETKIFTSDRLKTARANTWSFSQDFIDGISQCLGQKFDWDKNHKNKDLTDGSKKDPKIFDQNIHRTVDPKCVFLIGCKHHEMPEDKNTQDTYTKRDTFQRYRRNSRNIEMLTFDELYERAYFTVYNQKPDMTTLAIVDDETYEVNDFGDPELHELEGEENPDMKLSYDYVPAEETEVPIEDIPF